MIERIILHSDMNNFYASVECLYNPSLRGKPVAVAEDAEARHGIVLAKNYDAKRFGVATGDPLWMAKQKCPDIVFVPPHYDLYPSKNPLPLLPCRKGSGGRLLYEICGLFSQSV